MRVTIIHALYMYLIYLHNNTISYSSQPVPVPSDDVFAGIAAAKAQRASVDSAPLKTPPKWFRRPCGASFAVSCYIILLIVAGITHVVTLTSSSSHFSVCNIKKLGMNVGNMTSVYANTHECTNILIF